MAIKIIAKNYTQNPAAAHALQEQTRKAMQLSHKHIVRLHSLEKDAQRHFLVMELVEGQTIKDVSKLYHRLPLQTALQIGRVVAGAMTHAHRMAIHHGDIKPSNLLLTGDGVLKVTDFGDGILADLFKDAREPSTLLYMSPERHRGEPLDERSDIYSLAMVLYELISGELPFPDEIDDLASLGQGPSRWTDLPGAINDVFRKALAPDRTQRWATMEEFSRAFMEQVG